MRARTRWSDRHVLVVYIICMFTVSFAYACVVRTIGYVRVYATRDFKRQHTRTSLTHIIHLSHSHNNTHQIKNDATYPK